MTEPVVSPIPSRAAMKRASWLALGMLGVAAVGLTWMGLRAPRPTAPPNPANTKDSAPGGPVKPASTTVRITEPVFHPWPANREVIGPPAGSPSTLAPAARDRAARPQASLRSLAEPAAPSLAELRAESLRTGDEVTAEAAREVLLDDKKSSALKLTLIDKLRTQPPEEAVPVLLAFLEAPAGAGAAYTKPTAVKVLNDLKDPLAEQALATLARTSKDERVLMAIASLAAKEKAR